ncbi:hypothetical protein [Aeromicrobium wangtongii]|uniref:hypothetical protein n=1 Tax=Aeromicrobium wangtongii TaxID=2969247 RepID=UPI0020170BA8|nr:hypothetical protein [Aeromicrobium wangtongii]MCL3816997.1 hypothetical protein [Aeromicrobium wangtongii]
MNDETAEATMSRLREELATAVAAAADREQQLTADLHDRFVETAELTRRLLAAEKRASVAKKRAAALKVRVQELEIAASRRLSSRVRGRVRRTLTPTEAKS